MARNPRNPRNPRNLLARFDHPMQVTVSRAEFEPIESVGLLDLKKLGRGTHTVHIGSVSGGCCPSKVYAAVRDGYVVDVRIEPCSRHPRNPRKKKKLTSQAQAIIKEAKRRGYLKAKRRKWTPVPVDRFFSSPSQMAIIVTSEWDEGAGCATVCWGFGEIRDCVYCCGVKGVVTCLQIHVVVDDSKD